MRYEPEYIAAVYQQNLFRAALSITHNVSDAEDAVQNTYLQYVKSTQQFDSEDHLRAWLFRTVSNKAKDIVKAFWHRSRTSLEDWMNDIPFATAEDRCLAEAVPKLQLRDSSLLLRRLFRKRNSEHPVHLGKCRQAPAAEGQRKTQRATGKRD